LAAVLWHQSGWCAKPHSGLIANVPPFLPGCLPAAPDAHLLCDLLLQVMPRGMVCWAGGTGGPHWFVNVSRWQGRGPNLDWACPAVIHHQAQISEGVPNTCLYGYLACSPRKGVMWCQEGQEGQRMHCMLAPGGGGGNVILGLSGGTPTLKWTTCGTCHVGAPMDMHAMCGPLYEVLAAVGIMPSCVCMAGTCTCSLTTCPFALGVCASLVSCSWLIKKGSRTSICAGAK
jgi:hypothetical protein